MLEDYLPIRGVLSSRGNKWDGIVSKLLMTFKVPLSDWSGFLKSPPPDFVHCLYYEYKSLFNPEVDLSLQDLINNLVTYWNKETDYLKYPRKMKCNQITPTHH